MKSIAARYGFAQILSLPCLQELQILTAHLSMSHLLWEILYPELHSEFIQLNIVTRVENT